MMGWINDKFKNDGDKAPIAKRNPISDDYRLTGSVLGLGINGKVHECYHRVSQQKFALKVGVCIVFIKFNNNNRSIA